jgi:predicted nucleic acid-binding protein
VTWYLLDTNHLSAYLGENPLVKQRVDTQLRARDRFGITLPVLCEYRAGIAQGKRFQRNLARLRQAKGVLRLWPLDEQAAIEFAKISQELRSIGRIIPPFDMLIAASARQLGLTLLTADTDFQAVPRLRVENWLS